MNEALENSLSWLSDNAQTASQQTFVQLKSDITERLNNNQEIDQNELATMLSPYLEEALRSDDQMTIKAICALMLPDQASLQDIESFIPGFCDLFSNAETQDELLVDVECLLLAGRHQKKLLAAFKALMDEGLVDAHTPELMHAWARNAYFLQYFLDIARANPVPPLAHEVATAVADCVAADAFLAENVAHALGCLSAHGQLNFENSVTIVRELEHYNDHIEALDILFDGDDDPEQFTAENTLAIIEAVGQNGYYTETVCETLQLLKQHRLLVSEQAPTLIKLIGENGEHATRIAQMIEQDEDNLPSFETVLRSIMSLAR